MCTTDPGHRLRDDDLWVASEERFTGGILFASKAVGLKAIGFYDVDGFLLMKSVSDPHENEGARGGPLLKPESPNASTEVARKDEEVG